MKKILFFILTFSSFLVACEFCEDGHKDIKVENSFVKIVPTASKQTAIFMDIKNTSDKEITLVKATTTLSDATELHTHMKKDGMMKMMHVKDIKIPAKSTLHLKPGGYHIMVFNLKNPITKDTKADVTLEFSNGKKMTIKNIMGQDAKK